MSRWPHRLRVIEAAAWLTLLALLLRVLPLAQLLARCGIPPDPAPPRQGETGDATARALGHAVTVAARRLPWRPVCLPQALAAGLMLRRRGYAPRLGFGVKQTADGLTAHAWLTLADGIVYGGGMDADFVPFRSDAGAATTR